MLYEEGFSRQTPIRVVSTAGLKKRVGASANPDQPGSALIPNVPVVTHQGKTVRFYEDLIQGKIVLINFMYATCDGICPTQTANLVEVQNALGNRLGRDVFMISVSLDPERDTPEVLEQYSQIYKTKPGWLFLTGDSANLELLRRRLGFTDVNPEIDKDRSQHMGVVLIGNEALSRWSACPSLSAPPVLLELVNRMKDPQSTADPTRPQGVRATRPTPTCPVDRNRGMIPVAFQGQSYLVCSDACKQTFEANPQKILAQVNPRNPQPPMRNLASQTP